MKKFNVLLLCFCLTLVFIFTSCGTKSKDSEVTNNKDKGLSAETTRKDSKADTSDSTDANKENNNENKDNSDNEDNTIPKEGMTVLEEPEKIIDFVDPEFEKVIREVYELGDKPIRWKDIGYRERL